MKIWKTRRCAFVGAGLALACGGTVARPTAGIEPPPARSPQTWSFLAWESEKPMFSEAELAEVRGRFDLAALDYHGSPANEPDTAEATAILAGPAGSRASGVVDFEETKGQVLIHATLSGLPLGEHGFTIHEAGGCAERTRGSASHFDPTHQSHGPIGSPVRHVGDLGNVTVGAGGTATFSAATDSLRISGAGSIVGLTVIVHARRDDGKTQPTGNSGPAAACGVVLLAGARLALSR